MREYVPRKNNYKSLDTSQISKNNNFSPVFDHLDKIIR